MLLTGTGKVTSASVSEYSFCLLRDDGTVQCRGELKGCATCTPAQVDGITTAAAVEVPRSVSGNFACATLADGEVRCWGVNEYGQLGDGSRIDSPTPVKVLGLGAATQTVGRTFSGCALLSGGQVACWGEAVGRKRTASGAPALVPTLTGATQLSAYRDYTCARVSDGTARCWGNGYTGDGNAKEFTDLPRIAVSP